MPVVFMGTLDQDVNEVTGMRYAQLYMPGILNLDFSRKNFAWSAVQGLYSSFCLVMITIGISFNKIKLALSQCQTH